MTSNPSVQLVMELHERAANLRRGDWPRSADAALFEEAADFIEAMAGPFTLPTAELLQKASLDLERLEAKYESPPEPMLHLDGTPYTNQELGDQIKALRQQKAEYDRTYAEQINYLRAAELT